MTATSTEKMIEIRFSGECTIYEVAESQNKIIQKWPDQSQTINLNMSGVSDIDASFVQLLLSCKKTAHENNAQCHITNLPTVVEDKFQAMHVAEILSDNN